MNEKEFKKVVKRLVRAARVKTEKELASILSFKEIITEIAKVKVRIQDLV